MSDSQSPLPAEPGAAAPDAAEHFSEVYGELKQLASRKLRGQSKDATLNTTGLVHEVYLKLRSGRSRSIEDDGHFMALCATAMRQVIVDHARARLTKKRGIEWSKVILDPDLGSRNVDVESEAAFLLQLEGALSQLEANDQRLGKLIELRFFGGFSVAETAAVLGVSEPTVKRDSRVARSFLMRELTA